MSPAFKKGRPPQSEQTNEANNTNPHRSTHVSSFRFNKDANEFIPEMHSIPEETEETADHADLGEASGAAVAEVAEELPRGRAGRAAIGPCHRVRRAADGQMALTPRALHPGEDPGADPKEN